ncbi:unnamed protein product [Phaeothamnion confervicola]
MPARAADETAQIQLLKQAFRMMQPEWPALMNENKNLLDQSFFERCDARIRWGIENNQIDDAIRFSTVADTAMKVTGQKGTVYRMTLVYAFLKANNAIMAKDLLINVMLTDPEEHEAEFMYGSILKGDGSTVDAYNIYKKLAGMNYRKSDCLYQMGFIDLQIDRPEQGLKELKESAEIDPNGPAKALIAEYERTMPKLAPAGTPFQGMPLPTSAKGPEVSPRDVAEAKVYFDEGEASFKAGDMTKAKTGYLRAIQKNPAMAKAYSSLGAVLYREGDLNEAISKLSSASQLDSKDKETLRCLGYCFERRFDTKGDRLDLDKAIAYFQQVAKASPLDPQSKTEVDRVMNKKTPSASR